MKHGKVAKSEKPYLRGIIHNYSLQRWTDQEIADYLRVEKKIDIARSTVYKTRNQIDFMVTLLPICLFVAIVLIGLP